MKPYDLAWTTKPPTKEGWYWAVVCGNTSTPYIQLLCVHPDLHFMVDGVKVSVRDDFVSHWLGALPIPALPIK